MEGLVTLCQKAVKKDGPRIRRFLTVSRTDGCLGLTGHPDPSAMAFGAFVKSLVREYPGFPLRHVDISDQLSAAETELILQQELSLTEAAAPESARRDASSRLEFKVEPLPRGVESARFQPQADDVILITGGGRGITAECVQALARAVPARYVIMGRTKLREEEEWSVGLEDELRLKQAIAEQLAREQPGFVAKAIKDRFQDIMRGRALRSQLTSLKKLGREVHYFGIDITDAEKVAATVGQIERDIGPIRAMVHGAGIALDRKLHLKTFHDFDQVVRTKVTGLFHLLRSIAMDQLERIVFLSSVSALTGNAGQTDYALANGVLNGLSCYLPTVFPRLQATAIAYGPWNGGLVDGTLRQFFVRKGIALIEPDEGAASFVRVFLQPEAHGTLTLLARNPQGIDDSRNETISVGANL
jgi:NAD(P)-dependent dehydrogenase (short-subunit alcohol dehydrogenase family)